MRLVKIKWQDSNIQHGWQVDDSECRLALCEDVGWIIYEGENILKIARGISDHSFYNSPMAIPRGCILEIRELRVK